jgi:tetratricopeptide (TPR) repeat protein
MVIENLNKSITADPEYSPSYRRIAEQYYLTKQYDKAVEAAEKYLTLTEDPGTAKYQLAFYYFMAKQKDKSKEIFKEVTSSPDAPAVALKYYGRTLMEGDTTKASAQEAKPIFERYFAKVKPEDIDASDYAYYGKALAKLKENDLATQNFEQSIQLDSAQTDVLQLLGDTYMKMQKYNEAADAFKKLTSLRKQPLSQDLWSLGRAYFFAEKYFEADTAFTKLSEKQPKVIHGWFWAARSRANIDSTMSQGLAKPMYEKVLEIAQEAPEKYKKESVEAYSYLGAYTVQVIGNVNQAKPYYEKILAIDPNNEQAKSFFKTLNSPATNPQKGK